MARKPMKKFGTGKRYADAGTVTKAPEMSLNDIRLRRKTDDIQSDYMKAQARHAGNTAKLNIAKAKFEQRNADAKDDMAKWSGSDRTATRKGEADAEAALTQARRTRGQSIADRDTAAAKPTAAPAATTAATAAKPDYDKMSFAKAFAAARRVEGKPNFPWKGKSYNTNLASDKPATPAHRVMPAVKPAVKPAGNNTAAAAAKPVAPAVKPAGNNTAAAAAAAAKPATPAVNPATLKTPPTPLQQFAQASSEQQTAARRLHPEWFRPGGKYYSAPPTLGQYGTAISSFFSENTKRLEAQRKADAQAKATAEKAELGSLRKGGVIKKYAKGGSIDGCAIRGKTRAPRTR